MNYQANEVDGAGNCYPIFFGSFAAACDAVRKAQIERPDCDHFVTCPDRIDVDCPTGLTDEEWEVAP